MKQDADVIVIGGGIGGVAEEDVRAPLVVSNPGIRESVLRLAGEDFFPANYVEGVRKLTTGKLMEGLPRDRPPSRYKGIFRLYPQVEEHMMWYDTSMLDGISQFSARFQPDIIGIAQSVGQAGEKRPNPLTPVEGLYLVADMLS